MIKEKYKKNIKISLAILIIAICLFLLLNFKYINFNRSFEKSCNEFALQQLENKSFITRNNHKEVANNWCSCTLKYFTKDVANDIINSPKDKRKDILKNVITDDITMNCFQEANEKVKNKIEQIQTNK
jgi:hypothetical protein